MTETSVDTIFGKMVVEQQLCSEVELRRCRRELDRRKQQGPVTLDEVMVEMGCLTRSQAERLKGSIKESKAAAGEIPGYQILGKLGAGAMAVVYKARQISLDRTVAIKVLPRKFSENPDYVGRFYKEGRAAAQLNHNNIVQAIDVGEAAGRHYFVMEYVEGKTIYDDLADGKVFSETEALDIIIQVAEALEHAHERGLIHRDVKPKNIMINTAGVVKLADMGLARQTSDIEAAQSEAGKAYGTPYYIAPEQIRGRVDLDGRVDIYALGATLYHMVTGRVPFEAPSPAEVMKRHLKEDLVPPDHINTSLSTGISEVIEVMMAKNREDRYKNVKELLIDLRAVHNGGPPLQARKRFDLKQLVTLQQGAAVSSEPQEKLYKETTVAHYQIAVLILSAMVAVLLLFVIYLAVK